MNKKTILLICNSSSTVINFRKELIFFLLEKGYSVNVIVGDDKRENEIKQLGVSLFVVKFENRSINPFSFLALKRKIKSAIKEISPSCILTFQVKPNIVGSLAAKKCGVRNVISFVEGLGDPFQPHTLFQKGISKIVIFLYKMAFRGVRNVVFLNKDDKKGFISRHIVDEKKAVLINGIGIDTKKYAFSPDFPERKTVSMFARLLVNKGIIDFCKIASLVKKQRKDISFELYGEESQLTMKDIEPYIKSGDITYGGYTNNVSEKIANSRLIVSTSYREGFSRVLLECMAIGRPVVSYDVVGNKDTVKNGETGLLVPFGDMDDFAKKIILLVDDHELWMKLSQNARKACEEECDSNIINNQLFGIIENGKQKRSTFSTSTIIDTNGQGKNESGSR